MHLDARGACSGDDRSRTVDFFPSAVHHHQKTIRLYGFAVACRACQWDAEACESRFQCGEPIDHALVLDATKIIVFRRLAIA